MSEQQTALPIGTQVVTSREIPGPKHNDVEYGNLPVGAKGRVIGHTDDGRAMIDFGANVHTFDDPSEWGIVVVTVVGQWTDERIAETLPATYLYSCWWTDKDKAIALAKRVRDEMQAEIDDLRQRLTASRDANSKLIGEMERLERRLVEPQP